MSYQTKNCSRVIFLCAFFTTLQPLSRTRSHVILCSHKNIYSSFKYANKVSTVFFFLHVFFEKTFSVCRLNTAAIHLLYLLIPIQDNGGAYPSMQWLKGNATDNTHTHPHTHIFTSAGCVEFLVHLTCMTLNCGRKVEHPEETGTNSTQRGPWTLLLCR